jgi:endo-cleaving rubber dioxygenase
VPNLWEVLKPEDRKTIWRRLSMQGDIGGVRGFDYSLDTGYDAEHVGWHYEELPCGIGSLPLIDCNPVGGATLQNLLGLVWANGGLAWNLLNLPILAEQQIEDRKVYNTNYYSQSNAGHEFTSVLTDNERRAIIEYLKTL